MKKVKLFCFSMMTIALLCVSNNAFAWPTVPADFVTNIDLRNYENIVQTALQDITYNGVDYLAGDKIVLTPGADFDFSKWEYDFIGVFNINSLNESTAYEWTDGTNGEYLTGSFQYSITGASPISNGSRTLTVSMDSGDFFTAYLNDNDWNPTAIAAGETSAANMAADADVISGTKWMDAVSDGFSAQTELSNLTLNPLTTEIQQFIWMNVDFYQPGMELVAQEYPTLLGLFEPPPYTSEVFFDIEIGTINHDAGLTFAQGGHRDVNTSFHSSDPGYFYATPEPATFIMFGIGLLSLAGIVRRKA